MDYFYTATNRRSRGALWSIFAPALRLDIASFQSMILYPVAILSLYLTIESGRKEGLIRSAMAGWAGNTAFVDPFAIKKTKPNLLNHGPVDVMDFLAGDLAPNALRQISSEGLDSRTRAINICDALVQHQIKKYYTQPQTHVLCSFDPGYISPLNMLRNAPLYKVPLTDPSLGSQEVMVDGAKLTHVLNSRDKRPTRVLQYAAIACIFRCSPRKIDTALRGPLRREFRKRMIDELERHLSTKVC